MASYEQSVGATDEWYTPPYIFTALGEIFDVDVASPGELHTPWIPAHRFITRDSLQQEWSGFIWMNPPFGGRTLIKSKSGIFPWLERFVAHGDGIALSPDRTSAPWWQYFAPQMDAILFITPKIKFISGIGHPNDSPGQGTCLMAKGERAVAALLRASPRLGLVLIGSKQAAAPEAK